MRPYDSTTLAMSLAIAMTRCVYKRTIDMQSRIIDMSVEDIRVISAEMCAWIDERFLGG